jgi:hypothetical protein
MTRLDEFALRGRMARASRAMKILPTDDPAMTPEQQAILHLYDMFDAVLVRLADLGAATATGPVPLFRSRRKAAGPLFKSVAPVVGAVGPEFKSRRIAA